MLESRLVDKIDRNASLNWRQAWVESHFACRLLPPCTQYCSEMGTIQNHFYFQWSNLWFVLQLARLLVNEEDKRQRVLDACFKLLDDQVWLLLYFAIKSSFNSMGLFVKSWSRMIFHWCLCINNQEFLSTRGACVEVVFECEWRATCFGLLRVKLILALLGIPEWVWPLMDQYRMFFVRTSTRPPSMH